MVDQNAFLEAVVEGDPIPTLEVYRFASGVDMTDTCITADDKVTPKYKILRQSNGLVVLMIKRVQLTDAGEYKLNFKNTYGEDCVIEYLDVEP